MSSFRRLHQCTGNIFGLTRILTTRRSGQEGENIKGVTNTTIVVYVLWLLFMLFKQ